MKRIVLVILSIVFIFSLASCALNSNYLDNASPADLAQQSITALGTAVSYTTADAGYLDDYFQMPDYVTGSTIFFATEGNNLNEFGIFHVTNGNAKEMQTLLKNYLTESYEKNQAWYDSYIPQETPKLRDAEVKVFGNYAVYAIASKDDRTIFFDTVEKGLKD